MEDTYTTIVGIHNRITINYKVAKDQDIGPGSAVEVRVRIIGPLRNKK